MPRAGLLLATLVLLSGQGPVRADFIVNIDATEYGYDSGYTTFAQPPIGTVLHLVTPPSGPDQLTLAAGVYTITNAAGLPGANPGFTGWRFDGNATHWAWTFVMVDDATKRVIGGGDFGPFTSQAAAAADSSVQGFSTTLTLPATTTVDFLIRDYFLPDNAGGIALRIQDADTTSAAPEPGTLALLGMAGATLAGVRLRRWKLTARAEGCVPREPRAQTRAGRKNGRT